MYLAYFLNIDILALNIDILPDILNNDILSSYWKRAKYKILYFPRFQYEESIKVSYFSRIQTEAIKQMVAGESCFGEWVVSDGVGPQGRPHALFLGVSDVQQNSYRGGGEGQGWLMGIAMKDV